MMRTAFFRWDKLWPGARGNGPAVITGGEATVVVPRKFWFQTDSHGNLIIRKK
jgi:N-methylhydantoinase A/oxoprolinase/acetone carboxylase beta subunit